MWITFWGKIAENRALNEPYFSINKQVLRIRKSKKVSENSKKFLRYIYINAVFIKLLGEKNIMVEEKANYPSVEVVIKMEKTFRRSKD